MKGQQKMLFQEERMRKLLVYMKDFKKESILGPLFKLLEASFELLVPLVVTAIIDQGIQHQDVPFIIRMVILMVTLGVVGLACSLTAQYFAAKAAVGFTAKLKSALFAHIQKFSTAQAPHVAGPGTRTQRSGRGYGNARGTLIKNL